jgi:hypothetical protein
LQELEGRLQILKGENMKYLINYSCSVPEWGEVTIEADDESEACNMALREVRLLYPEAIDIEIDGVEKIG